MAAYSCFGCASIVLLLLLLLLSEDCIASKCQRSYECDAKDCSGAPHLINSTILVHVVVLSPPNALHYLWGLVGHPAILVVETPSNKLNCTQHLDLLDLDVPSYVTKQSYHSVSLKGVPVDREYALALLFQSLVEFTVADSESANSFELDKFNESFWSSESFECKTIRTWFEDVEKTEDQSYCVRPLSDVQWQRLQSGNIITGEIFYQGWDKTDSIRLLFDPKDSTGHESYFPSPFYTPQSAVLDMVLSGVNYNLSKDGLGVAHSRMAFQFLLVHGPAMKMGHFTDPVFNNDDEYTPSVFFTQLFKAQCNGTAGYMTYKGISYENSDRVSSKSQQVARKEFGNSSTQSVPGSLCTAVFGDNVGPVERIFLVVGTEGDEFLNTKYFTWTAVLGVGTPPVENISSVVLIIIMVGFGLPVAMVLIAVIYVFVSKAIWKPYKKYKSKKTSSGYTTING